MNEEISFEDKINDAIEKIKVLLRAGNHLALSWSSGKDSTCCLILMLEAIKQMLSAGEPVLKCYILNVNTRREMPAMDHYVMGQMAELRMYLTRYELPVEVIEVEPSLSGRFTWTVIGRGKLPRYIGNSKDCSRDEKILPQQRIVKKLKAASNGNYISLVGVRLDESAIRRKTMKRFHMDGVTISILNDTYTYAPIAEWTLDDVWELISGCSSHDNQKAPRLFSTYTRNFHNLMTLYRDANSGVCGVIFGDAGNKTPCGSRFGCAWCTPSGNSSLGDKSLESLIKENEELYGYMKGLVQFRKFLYAIRWDMNRRDFRGRKISDVGYLKLKPDYFSSQTKREILRYLLTLDKLEEERAAKFSELYNTGKVQKTPENYALTHAMFQFIQFSDIVAIDFQWSLLGDFSNEASPAAKDWIEVHDMGVKYHIPAIPEEPRVTIPEARWFYIQKEMESDQIGSLYDLPHRNSGVNVEFNNLLSVELGAGNEYISLVRENYYNLNEIDSMDIVRICLHRGYIKISKSEMKTYETIYRRNQALRNIMKREQPMKINLFNHEEQMMTVHEYLLQESISDEQHSEILKQKLIESIINKPQYDIFGTDSIIQVMDITPSPVKSVTERITTESVNTYTEKAKQSSIFD